MAQLNPNWDINNINLNLNNPNANDYNAHIAIVERNNFQNMYNTIVRGVADCNGNLDTVKRILIAHLDWIILMNSPANTVILAGDFQNIYRNYSMNNNYIVNNGEQAVIDDFIHTVMGLTQAQRKLYINFLRSV